LIYEGERVERNYGGTKRRANQWIMSSTSSPTDFFYFKTKAQMFFQVLIGLVN